MYKLTAVIVKQLEPMKVFWFLFNTENNGLKRYLSKADISGKCHLIDSDANTSLIYIQCLQELCLITIQSAYQSVRAGKILVYRIMYGSLYITIRGHGWCNWSIIFTWEAVTDENSLTNHFTSDQHFVIYGKRNCISCTLWYALNKPTTRKLTSMAHLAIPVLRCHAQTRYFDIKYGDISLSYKHVNFTQNPIFLPFGQLC